MVFYCALTAGYHIMVYESMVRILPMFWYSFSRSYPCLISYAPKLHIVIYLKRRKMKGINHQTKYQDHYLVECRGQMPSPTAKSICICLCIYVWVYMFVCVRTHKKCVSKVAS